MNEELFLKNLAEILGTTSAHLTRERRLRDFRGWDSMGQMALLTLLDTDVGVPVPANWITTCETVGQVLDLVAPKLKSPL